MNLPGPYRRHLQVYPDLSLGEAPHHPGPRTRTGDRLPASGRRLDDPGADQFPARGGDGA